jgi:hypothetical protein
VSSKEPLGLLSVLLFESAVFWRFRMATRRLARFSDSFLCSSGVRSFAAFLTLGCFFSPLPAAGATASLAVGSIACAFAAAATQFLGEGFGGRRLPLAEGTAK